MQRMNEEFIFILAGSCFCAFLFVVSLGGVFLFWRIRQQENSGTPPPEPPVMTRDAHASEPESSAPTIRSVRPPMPMPAPPPPAPPPPRAPAISEAEAIGLTASEDDDTRVRPKPHTESAAPRRAPPPPLTPITLPDDDDEDSPTVIVDRSKPFDPEDDL